MKDTAVPASGHSTDSIAWKAYRQADKLDDLELVKQLSAMLPFERDKKTRDAAYFIIGKVGANLRSSACADVLIGRLPDEKDKYILAGMLDRLADIPKPVGTNLKPILGFLDDSRWLVRRAAIGALRGTQDLDAEEALISLLDRTSDPHDIASIHATLCYIGTPRCIPFLERSLNSRKRDVKASAKFALREIGKRHGVA